MRSATAILGRAAARVAAFLAVLGLVAGVPVFLALAFGWPLPATVPTTWNGWEMVLTAPISDAAILRLLAIAGWLLWTAFLRALWIEARDACQGVRTAHHFPGLHPLRTLAAGLVLTIAAGSIASGFVRPTTATAAPAIALAAAPPVTALPETAPWPTVHFAPLLPAGPAVLKIKGCSHLHTVVRGESLWSIAEKCLGDGRRWPEIWRLNEGRFWPEVSGYKRFTDPDLIYPRWTLRLPADAVAAPDLPQVAPSDPPPPAVTPDPGSTPTRPETNTPDAKPTEPAFTPPTTNTAPAIVPPAVSPPTPSVPQTPTPPAPPSAPVDDEEGLSLPGEGWVPWALATAIAAAGAMVWLQRRRRPLFHDADSHSDLPTPVRQLDRAVRHNPDLVQPDTDVEKAAAVPAQQLPPPGGLGVIGEAAPAVARAALVAALAAGGPRNPHDRAEVIIDAEMLATLIGPDAVHLAEWPRLHIADNFDAALLQTEAEILRRSRILSYHDTATLDLLRHQVPDEEALPPLLLICKAPIPSQPAARLEVTAALGARVNISTLMLGEWAHGPTIDVESDGHARLVGERVSQLQLPDRMAVLEPQATTQILFTLREAHTGTRPAQSAASQQRATHAPVTTARIQTAVTDEAAAAPAGCAPGGQSARPQADARSDVAPPKARLRVLGRPGIDNVTAPGRPLRAKALELAVFLACHPDGAATRDIGEHLAPDYTLSKADQQVHTNASNLRHVFARAAGPRHDGYIRRMPGESAARYRLDPGTVEVDLWQLRDLLRAATLASGHHRRDLLAAACALHTGLLAEGTDYDWIMPFRETALRWGSEAHLLYAEALLDTSPQVAADVLDHAIRLDPHNERLYVQALHARHAVHDRDGLRVIMRALTKALADLDAEPSEETIAQYERLRASLEERT
jgi:hypothetical protein